MKNKKQISEIKIEKTDDSLNEDKKRFFFSPLLQRSADSRRVPVPFFCSSESGKVSLCVWGVFICVYVS